MTENRENGQPENGKTPAPEQPGPAEETAPPSAGGEQVPRDPIGSVAEEAMKLFDALQQRVGREFGKGVVKGGVSGLGQAFGSGGGRGAASDVWSEAVAGHHGEEEYICRACPICRVKAAGRESGGEVTDHLVAAGGELFAAFRQALDALQRPASGSRPGEPRQSRVEHIDLG